MGRRVRREGDGIDDKGQSLLRGVIPVHGPEGEGVFLRRPDVRIRRTRDDAGCVERQTGGQCRIALLNTPRCAGGKGSRGHVRGQGNGLTNVTGKLGGCSAGVQPLRRFHGEAKRPAEVHRADGGRLCVAGIADLVGRIIFIELSLFPGIIRIEYRVRYAVGFVRFDFVVLWCVLKSNAGIIINFYVVVVDAADDGVCDVDVLTSVNLRAFFGCVANKRAVVYRGLNVAVICVQPTARAIVLIGFVAGEGAVYHRCFAVSVRIKMQSTAL